MLRRIRPPGITSHAARGLSSAGGAVVALPAGPASLLHTVPLQQVNDDLAETIGWQQLVTLVSRLYGAAARAARHHHHPGR
jgi:hypothetical protein